MQVITEKMGMDMLIHQVTVPNGTNGALIRPLAKLSRAVKITDTSD